MKTLTLKIILAIQLHNINTVISELQITASKLFTWFNNYHMKVNPEKSHLRVPNSEKRLFAEALVESNSTEKLGMKTDSDLTFDGYISSICNKVGKK